MNTSNNGNILIEYEKVTANAENIKRCAGDMNTKLERFNNLILSIKKNEIQLGKSADALEDTFLQLRQHFDEYIKMVQNFSNMILYANNATKETEKQAQKDANELPN